jgi:hypothetical protein
MVEKMRDGATEEDLLAMMQTLKSLSTSICSKVHVAELGQVALAMKETNLDLSRKALTSEWFEYNFFGLRPIGVKALLNFTLALFEGAEVDAEVTSILLEIGSYSTECQGQIFAFLQKCKGYSDGDFASQIAGWPKSGKHIYSALLSSKETPFDREGLLKATAAAFNDEYLDDKKIVPVSDIAVFLPFLGSLNSQEFISLVFPDLEFAMNRSNKLLEHTIATVTALKKCEINDEFLSKVGEELFKEAHHFNVATSHLMVKYYKFIS